MKLIIGFKFKVTDFVVIKNNRKKACNHDFDREKNKYCSECGNRAYYESEHSYYDKENNRVNLSAYLTRKFKGLNVILEGCDYFYVGLFVYVNDDNDTSYIFDVDMEDFNKYIKDEQLAEVAIQYKIPTMLFIHDDDNDY